MRVRIALLLLLGLLPFAAQAEAADTTVADRLVQRSSSSGASVGGGSAPSSGTRALADFDGDGRDDLAIGVPQEDVGAVEDAGAVQIFYSTASGLTGTGSDFFTQDDIAGSDGAEANDLFGTSVTAGDFNGDGRDDIAVGAPDDSIGAVNQAGSVSVLYGSPGGISASGSQFIDQDFAPNWYEAPEAGDRFGWALAAGRFNDGPTYDLAISARSETYESGIDAASNAGWVGTINGEGSGLTTDDPVPLRQGSLMEDAPEDDEAFGFSLAAGDFGYSDRHDLAVGVVFETPDGNTRAGAVHVFYSSKYTVETNEYDGLNPLNDQLWTQNSDGVKDYSAGGEVFGYAMAAGDFGRNAKMDLAVGVPNESDGAQDVAGGVHVLYGGKRGIRAKGNQIFGQNSAGIPEKAELQDVMGVGLATGDFGKGPTDDLAVGIPGEDYGTGATSIYQGGAAIIMYSTETGLGSGGSQLWSQNSTGIADTAEVYDWFGSVIVSGNFGKNTRDDLVFGVSETLNDGPGELVNAGALNVLFGSKNGVTSAGNQFITQDSAGSPDPAEDDDHLGGHLELTQ